MTDSLDQYRAARDAALLHWQTFQTRHPGWRLLVDYSARMSDDALDCVFEMCVMDDDANAVTRRWTAWQLAMAAEPGPMAVEDLGSMIAELMRRRDAVAPTPEDRDGE